VISAVFSINNLSFRNLHFLTSINFNINLNNILNKTSVSSLRGPKYYGIQHNHGHVKIKYTYFVLPSEVFKFKILIIP